MIVEIFTNQLLDFTTDTDEWMRLFDRPVDLAKYPAVDPHGLVGSGHPALSQREAIERGFVGFPVSDGVEPVFEIYNRIKRKVCHRSGNLEEMSTRIFNS